MTGLVLEGGGLRGLFSEGVFDVMLEEGITFDGMIGVSAGVSIGCNFKSRQIGRSLRYNQRFAGDPRYIGLRSWIKTGDLVGAEFAYDYMPTHLDIFDKEAYDNNPMKLYAVATDVDTGMPVYKELPEVNRECLDWLRASSSMPVVSRVVELDGMRLLDGGISNSIPLRKFQEMGYGRNVVVLTQPRDYKKKPTKLVPLFKLALRKYPKVVEAMRHRHEMYNAQLDFVSAEESKGNTLVICPDVPLPIGRVEMKPEKMKIVYDMGREKGLKMLDEIKSFMLRQA